MGLRMGGVHFTDSRFGVTLIVGLLTSALAFAENFQQLQMPES